MAKREPTDEEIVALFTPEREEVLRDRFPTKESVDAIHRRINRLPGPFVSRGFIPKRAQTLGLIRQPVTTPIAINVVQSVPTEDAPIMWCEAVEWAAANKVPLAGTAVEFIKAVNAARVTEGLPKFRIIDLAERFTIVRRRRERLPESVG